MRNRFIMGIGRSPERKKLPSIIDTTQSCINGWIRIKRYKGNVIIVGSGSKTDSLYAPDISTFEDEEGVYSQVDAENFIKLNALPTIAEKIRELCGVGKC